MSVSSPDFWNERYLKRETGWDLGGPTPALVTVDLPRGGTAAVPGCGRGYDVALLADRGFKVWGFDFSPAAIAEAKPHPGAKYLLRDIFTLGAEFPGEFDLAWEYTCYCAIDPARRPEYAKVLHDILKPGGELVALFYPVKPTEGGPPFEVKREEIDKNFAGFRIVSVAAPANSIERRAGAELLVRMKKETR